MSKIYCLSINNRDKREISIEDVNELTEFVRNLYIQKSDDPSKLNFVPYYSKATDGICIKIGGKSKANIEKVNSILTDKDLRWKYNIYLSKPSEFNAEQVLSFDVTSGRKWDSILQQGPYFAEIMEPYKHLGASLYLREKEYKLKPEEEKVAGFYARRKIAEEKDNITKTYTRPIKHETEAQKQARILFNKNFWKDFQTYLSPEAKKIFRTENDFLDIDWSDLIQKINDNKEKDDKNTKNRKNAEKIFRYGYATLNGVPYQKLSNFSVELSGIFYGVGANERLGRIKKQIFPEDVTLNLGKEDTEPEPPPGHKWGRIATHHNLEWVATWKDSVTGKNKYIWFSPEGAFKAQSDIKKYEKARQLHTQLNKIRTQYMIDANSSDKTLQQLGTVLYLIDHFGIRVGNEKDEDEAETVGATTLFFKNVDLDDTNKRVIFNFLGKDSVPFQKELEVDPIIFKNFQRLLEGKKTEEYNNKQIFQITSENINKYLKDFGDFSAKVFRTRLANDIMYHALQNVEIPDKATNKVIKFNFAKANVEVAKVLNHSRSPSIKALESLEKLKTELETATSKKDVKKIATLTQNIESKENVLSVAINTSLANYIDPRLVISWTKAKEVSPNAIYTATLLNKFKWAVERTEEGWDWENSVLEDIDEEDKKKPARAAPSTAKKPPTRVPPSTAKKPPTRVPPSTAKSTAKTPPARVPPSTAKSTAKTPPARVPPITAKSTAKTPPPQDPFLGKFGPATIKDYKLLLELCENLENYSTNIYQVNPDVLDFIYPLCKEAVKRGVNIDATKFIVDFYEKKLLKRPEDDTPVTENVSKQASESSEDDKPPIPPPQKKKIQKAKTPKTPPESSDEDDKPPIPPLPKKKIQKAKIPKTPPESSDEDDTPPPQKKKNQKDKIKKTPPQVFIIPSDNFRFTYLNTHKNEKLLRKYCEDYGIPIQEKYNMREIKIAIMNFYKDTPALKIPWDSPKPKPKEDEDAKKV